MSEHVVRATLVTENVVAGEDVATPPTTFTTNKTTPRGSEPVTNVCENRSRKTAIPRSVASRFFNIFIY
jgi:hypothetical protein